MDNTAVMQNCVDKIKHNISRYVEADNNFDDIKYWQTIEPFILEIDSKIEWDLKNIKKLYTSLTGHSDIPNIKDHPDTYYDQLVKGIGLDNINEFGTLIKKNHLFIQLFHLPLYEPNTFDKLMEIMFTIGQLNIYIDSFDGHYTRFFKDNNMDKLDTYMKSITFGPDDIVKMNDLIDFINTKDEEIIFEIDRSKDIEINEEAPDDLMTGGFLNDNYYHKYRKYKNKYLSKILKF